MLKLVASTLLYLLLSGVSISTAFCAQLFVDFENGNDQNSGKDNAQPWKHSPGDLNATGEAKSHKLTAGDRVIFKGGIHYFGNIVVPSNGDRTAPIIFTGDAWGEHKAIINGGVSRTLKLNKCISASSCNNNKNWRALLFAEGFEPIDPFSPLSIDDKRYWIAQTPNMPDPFWFDDLKNYSRIPKNNPEFRITSESLRLDSKAFLYGKEKWGEAWIAVWLKPNKIAVSKVTEVDTRSQTVFFHKQKHKPYLKRDSFYSFFNRPEDVDRPGEFSVDSRNKRILIWPYKNMPAGEASVQVAMRPRAFDLNGHSNISIVGFEIRNFVGGLKGWRHGSAIINSRSGSKNIVVRNNLIRNLRSAEGVGAIQLNHVENVLIEQNVISDNQKNSGIRLAKSSNVIVKNNQIRRIGRTGIRLIGNHRIQVSGNELSEIKGVHGNGMSVYLKNTDILVADNYVSETPNAFTYHGTRVADEARNLWILNNVFLGRVNSWGKDMSRISMLHNLFYAPNSPRKSLQIPDRDRKVVAINNIIDGWLVKKIPPDWIVSNNLYSSLSQAQKSKYNWSLERGGIVDRRLSLQILSALKGDPKIDRPFGVDISVYLPINIFPEFDFSYWQEPRLVGPRSYGGIPENLENSLIKN